MVAGVKCDFMDELKSALVQLQDTVDKISLEQIKTNKKVDQLEEKIEKLGTKVITLEDLNEVNNNISDAIDQLKTDVKTFIQEKHSGNGCTKLSETNVANIAIENQEDHIDALKHVVQEEEEKGKNIICLRA